jgi:hypothetical protein
MSAASPAPSITRRRFLVGTALAAGAVALGGAAAVVLARTRGLIGWNRDAGWVGARREFFRGPFSADDLRSLAAGGVRPVVSYKPDLSWPEVAAGSADADLDLMHAALVEAAVPADVAFHHEPENDEAGHPNATVPRGTADDYTAAAARFAERVTDGTDARFVLCLMSSGYETAPERWECGAEQAYAVDAYNQFGARGDVWSSLEELITPMDTFARSRGLGAGVWECNAMEDPADPSRKATWITAAADTAQELQLETLLFFDGGDYAWSLLSSPQAEEAVHRAAARDYFAG